MTQEEKLLARLKTLDGSALYEIIVYVTPDKTIGFWIVKKQPDKIEGESKRDIMAIERTSDVICSR
jgi:hypothetical protein